jgi:hypothetical protein
MTDSVREHVSILLNRLWSACAQFPDYGLESHDGLWARGVLIIERKYGLMIYLNKFEPVGGIEVGLIEGEMPTTKITITPIES